MTILLNTIYRFSVIPIRLLMAFFTELEPKISQFIWKHKTLNSQSSLEKEEWSWRNQLSWLQIILQSYSHKDSLAQNRNIDQWNKIESPEISPHTYGYLMFYKGDKNIQWGKDNLFDTWCWENWTAICQRIMGYFLTPHSKINTKWRKDLYLRPETKIC